MKRNKTIMLRLTEAEKEAIEAYAKTQHIPAAVLVRKVVLDLVKDNTKPD